MTPVHLRSWERDALAVPCPHCKAPDGGWCRSKTGRVASSLHSDRYAKVDADVQGDLFTENYPDPPAHSHGPDTERTAITAERTGHLRVLTLRTLTQHPEGMTAGQLSEATGVYLYSIAPRVTELCRDGYAADTGRRMRSDRNRPAIVWEATPRGRDWLNGLEGE